MIILLVNLKENLKLDLCHNSLHNRHYIKIHYQISNVLHRLKNLNTPRNGKHIFIIKFLSISFTHFDYYYISYNGCFIKIKYRPLMKTLKP